VVTRRSALATAFVALIAGCTREGSPTSRTTAPQDTALAPNAVVDRIVDGDTIDVVVDGREERVRLIGIDTPEVAHPSSGDRPGNPAECFGDEAKRFTETMLGSGTPIRLERDIVARDDYGRLLAYVHRAGDGIFVNYEIVRQGFAQPLTIAPNDRFAPLFVEAAQLAEADDAGLWSSCRDR
jgi:micrococcal nuclease